MVNLGAMVLMARLFILALRVNGKNLKITYLMHLVIYEER
jgi:hypothetical protein